MPRLPLIGVSACAKQSGPQTQHTAGDKCVRAVASSQWGAGLPLIITALAELLDNLDALRIAAGYGCD